MKWEIQESNLNSTTSCDQIIQQNFALGSSSNNNIVKLNEKSNESDSNRIKIVTKEDEKESVAEQSIRKDKAFKNVFRAPKKYYLSLLKTSSNFFKSHSKSERKIAVFSELDDFVKRFFINKDTQ